MEKDVCILKESLTPFFPPQMIPQFQFVFIPHITVEDAVNKNDSTYGLRDSETEQSGEIMQPRLTVMDS